MLLKLHEAVPLMGMEFGLMTRPKWRESDAGGDRSIVDGSAGFGGNGEGVRENI